MNGPLCWYLRRRVPLTLSSCSVSVPQCPKMKVTYFLVESELFRQRYIIYACRRRGIISIISVLQYAHWLRSVLLVLVVSWTKTPLPSQWKQSINYSLMQYVHPRSSWDSHRSSHCRIIRPFEFCHQSVYFLLIDWRDLLCLHIGHCPFEESCLIHSTMQC